MPAPVSPSTTPSHATSRGRHAAGIVEHVLGAGGWRIQARAAPDHGKGATAGDIIARHGNVSYLVEIKTAPEGRADRLIPLWSQAYLETARRIDRGRRAMIIVAAPRVAPRAAEQVLRFAAEHAPDVASGVIDFVGLVRFQGPHVENLAVGEASAVARTPGGHAVHHALANLFSDLNQWMLKVLLAPELPANLLSGPRDHYRNATHLAEAAGVSVMSAFRFVERLRREGYLHESASRLTLVRREELFERWRAAASVQRVKEVPARFLLRANPKAELRRLLRTGEACAALFAAADALRLGHVRGIPPYVYVPRLAPETITGWKNLVPADSGETPDVIIRQAPAPRSVFRGLVHVDGVPVSDVIQVWLDVSSHPSRGREQADLIFRRVLARVVSGDRTRG